MIIREEKSESFQTYKAVFHSTEVKIFIEIFTFLLTKLQGDK